jgi:hypothetical protein
MVDEAFAANRSSMPPSHMDARAFSAAARLRSFAYAGRGIGKMIASQHNAWIHVAVTLSVAGHRVMPAQPRPVVDASRVR